MKDLTANQAGLKEVAVKEFSGGINDIVEPHLIGVNNAIDLLNADISNGSIQSLFGQAQTTIDSDSELIYQNGERQIVQWGKNFFWSDNSTGELSSSLGYFGVPTPTLQCSVSEGGAGANFITDKVYRYMYSFRTADGFRSAPNALQITDFIPSTDLDNSLVSNFGVIPDQAIYVEIWRTIADGGTFYLAGIQDIFQINLDGTVFFDDDLGDTRLLLNEQLDLSNLTDAPTEGKYLVEKNSVFYIADGPFVRFSNVGDPMAYPAVNSVTFDDDITAMLAFEEYIFVATLNRTYILLGDDFNTITKRQLPDAQGVSNWKTVERVRNMPVWVSNDGVCAYQAYDNRSGRKISIISEDLKQIPEGSLSAEVANDIYYLFYDTYAIMFDFKRGLKVTRVEWIADWAWYDKDSDQLIIKRGDAYFAANTGKQLEFMYLSPEFTFGDMHKLKQIARIHIDSDCDLDIDYYNDGDYSSSYKSILGDHEQRRFYVPPEWRGRRLQIRIRGFGQLRGYKMEFVIRKT